MGRSLAASANLWETPLASSDETSIGSHDARWLPWGSGIFWVETLCRQLWDLCASFGRRTIDKHKHSWTLLGPEKRQGIFCERRNWMWCETSFLRELRWIKSGRWLKARSKKWFESPGSQFDLRVFPPTSLATATLSHSASYPPLFSPKFALWTKPTASTLAPDPH